MVPALLSACLHAGGARAEPAIWVAPATDKIRPDAVPDTTEPGLPVARLAAARNELEAFQIVVRSPAGVEGIHAEASPLVGPGGAEISPEQIRFYRVELVSLTKPSDRKGAAGRCPDPLLPVIDDLDGSPRSGFPLDAAPGEARAIWVEVHVPEDAPPGIYRGEIVLLGSELHGLAVEVELEVFGFSLPSTPTLRTYFHVDNLALCRGHHGDPSCGDWGDNKIDLLDRYARLALDHRITLGNIYYQTFRPRDFRAFDQRYAPLLDGTARTRLRGARLTSVNYPGPLEAPSLRGFVDHLRERGWLDRVFDHAGDEPGVYSSWAEIRDRCHLLDVLAPELPLLITTSLPFTGAEADEMAGKLDVIAPVVNLLEGAPGSRHPGDQSATIRAYLAAGGELWVYQSCMSHDCGKGGHGPGGPAAAHGAKHGATHADGRGYPSLVIDHPGLRNRALEWIAFRHGVTGELYWAVTFAYDDDPWSDAYRFTGNGDGTLFYPGTREVVGGRGHTPVASQRLKLVRDGIEDYEYLSLVARLGDPAFAHAQASQVFPAAYDIGSDARPLERARIALARRIEVLLEERRAVAQTKAPRPSSERGARPRPSARGARPQLPSRDARLRPLSARDERPGPARSVADGLGGCTQAGGLVMAGDEGRVGARGGVRGAAGTPKLARALADLLTLLLVLALARHGCGPSGVGSPLPWAALGRAALSSRAAGDAPPQPPRSPGR